VEDLTSSWDAALAVPVPPVSEPLVCPDKDGDGAPDAWTCNMTGTDCDDNDPAVNPTTERWIPPGPFLMGSASSHAGADEGPVHVVELSGYCLDVAELTDATGAVREGITWEEAGAACKALGKTLPTEAQWEKAARGGCELGDDRSACDPADLRPYPWGTDTPSCTHANHQESTGTPTICEGSASAKVRNTGPYGHTEMAGNVWEWVADWYHPRVYHRDPERVDPLGPASGSLHVLRGGGWNTFSTNMRVANRLTSNLEGGANGVRCGRSGKEGNWDAVEPLRTTWLRGVVTGGDGPLTGRALYLTAFDAADADPLSGMVAPGRSPVAETKLVPAGETSLPFALEVPVGSSYLLMAALDAGAPTVKGGKWMAPSGSGGFGKADQNPVKAEEAPVEGLTVTIRSMTMGAGPGGPPPGGGPAGPPPGGGPAGPPPGGAPAGPPLGGTPGG
jgi:formylglycine-generating enzyme required for sulfatase activity